MSNCLIVLKSRLPGEQTKRFGDVSGTTGIDTRPYKPMLGIYEAPLSNNQVSIDTAGQLYVKYFLGVLIRRNRLSPK